MFWRNLYFAARVETRTVRWELVPARQDKAPRPGAGLVKHSVPIKSSPAPLRGAL